MLMARQCRRACRTMSSVHSSIKLLNREGGGVPTGLLMNSDDFNRFLELLSLTNGGEEGGRCYIRLHRRLEGFFTMRGVGDPAGAADATVDLAVKKIAAGTPVPDAGKYCMGI